jgi:DNA-binding transcriptional LysR family regulator
VDHHAVFTLSVGSPSVLGRFQRSSLHVATTPIYTLYGPCASLGVRPFETWEVAGTKQKIEPVLVVNDLEVACDAAIAGVGVARLPSLVCRDAVHDGRLTVLFGADPGLLRPVYAVYPSRAYLPVKVRAFVDALERLVDPMLPIDEGRPARGRRRRARG